MAAGGREADWRLLSHLAQRHRGYRPRLSNRNKLAESGDDSPIEAERAVYARITESLCGPLHETANSRPASPAALLLSGCATIVGNETQLVRIDSLPQGARLPVPQVGRGYAVAQGFAPQTVELEKSTRQLLRQKAPTC